MPALQHSPGIRQWFQPQRFDGFYAEAPAEEKGPTSAMSVPRVPQECGTDRALPGVCKQGVFPMVPRPLSARCERLLNPEAPIVGSFMALPLGVERTFWGPRSVSESAWYIATSSNDHSLSVS